jgi:hypothetical protein
MTEQPPTSTPPPTGDHSPSRSLAAVNRLDLGIVALGVLTFIFSLLPYYTVTGSFAGFSSSGSVSAWHGFFGWFGALCALAAAVVLLVHVLGVVTLPVPVRTTVLALFAAAALCTILALFVIPGGGGDIKGAGFKVDSGHAIGYWLALLATLGGTALAFMRKDENA